MDLLDLPLQGFLDALASEQRSPASGSLAAVVTAAAAGLLEKAARNSGDGWTDANGIAAQAEKLRGRAGGLAQADADAYAAALRLLEETEPESGERRDFEVGKAFAAAAEPPLQIVEVATDVAVLAGIVVRHGVAALRADAAAAGALAAAAARAAAELVAVNLTATADDERVRRALLLAGEAARASEEAFASGENS